MCKGSFIANGFIMFSPSATLRTIQNAPPTSAQIEARLIDCVRVLCITFMMFTHLKEYEQSSVYGGDLNILGVLTNDYLGRASVPALSLISGYLLVLGWKKIDAPDLRKFTIRKTNRVIVPMLTWNLIYILTVAAAYFTINYQHRVIEIIQDGSFIDIVNAFTSLTSSPANFTLHFIRDLFVTQILIFGILSLCGRYRIPILIAFGGYALIAQMEPIISRELIVVFLVAGALMALYGVRLISLASSRAVLVVCLAMLAVLIAWGPQPRINVSSYTFFDLFMRIGISLSIIVVSFYLAHLSIWKVFRFLAPVSFLTYLLHLPVTSMLWALWSKVYPSNDGLAYVAYYFLAPLLAWSIAITLSTGLNKRPALASVLGLKE
ncbi:acyltransferase family protein [Paracoccus hibiscisoli]|uniref:Acyltransferase n=1 Tax=Paracoccus hibiscisoli TaxID=2023261 RepID=A0A4U0QDL1_9RHOB|nr:acyltransferase [Paracoccus hibiscisoli]